MPVLTWYLVEIPVALINMALVMWKQCSICWFSIDAHCQMAVSFLNVLFISHHSLYLNSELQPSCLLDNGVEMASKRRIFTSLILKYSVG